MHHIICRFSPFASIDSVKKLIDKEFLFEKIVNEAYPINVVIYSSHII